MNLISFCDGANTSGFVAKKLGIDHLFSVDKNEHLKRLTKAEIISDMQDWSKSASISHSLIDIAYFKSPKMQHPIQGYSPYDQFFFKEFFKFLDLKKPKWLVWEIHPRIILSSNGREFKRIVGELTALGYGVSWRVFNSSSFRSPIESEKMYLVGHFGSWEETRSVLFEEESSIGHFEIEDEKRASGELSAVSKDKRAIEVTAEMILLAQNLPENYLSKVPKKERAKVAKNASNALMLEFILSRIKLLSQSS